jgi:hypothetical protein
MARAHLYGTYLAESLRIPSDEGLPHLEIHGVPARVELEEKKVPPFCRLAGFTDGYIKTSVRLFGGYIWKLNTIECAFNHSVCASEVTLLNKWFNGVYIKCHYNKNQLDSSP